MSQRIVYQILKELGGKATRKQIKKVAQTKALEYPSLQHSVDNRLFQLKKWGYIDSEGANNRTFWIISDYPDTELVESVN